MKHTAFFALFAWALSALLWAEPVVDHPTGKRTTPPVILSVSPLGISRGITNNIEIEGYNLGGASAVYFSKPGVRGRIVSVKELPDVPEPPRLGAGGLPSTIDLGPLPPRHQVTIAADVDAGADIGAVRFRLLTPLGTSPDSKVVLEPYWGERPDAEPNNNLQTATKTFLPAILAGAISQPGDEDHFEIHVEAGDELTFQDSGALLGSALKPMIAVLASDHSVLREFGGFETAPAFAYRFEKAGTCYVRVSDYEKSGSKAHLYRIRVGPVPLIAAVYPLGLQRGKTARIAVAGFNLGTETVTVQGEPSAEDDRFLELRPETPSGRTFNTLKLHLEDYPEIESNGTNTSFASAPQVSAPVTINGRIGAPGGEGPVAHYFRFAAKKSEQLVLDVKAARLGSQLDSLIDVLDTNGEPVEQATVRAVAQTHVTLRDFNSISPGIRIQSWKDFGVGDHLMIGGEITRVVRLPRGPDEDVLFDAYPPVTAATLAFRSRSQRKAFFATSPEAHAIDRPAYKVQIHPPGKEFAGNGLPLVRLPYRNDDGGPGHGPDSRLAFVAPRDGVYVLRIRDAQGFGGERYPYRIVMAPPRPDFRIQVTPPNPNVPLGGRVLVSVLAERVDDFKGPIHLSVEGLPAGLRADKAVIPEEEYTTTFILSADADAKLEQAVPFLVTGTARIEGRDLVRRADPGDSLMHIALRPGADVSMMSETREVVLEPGGQAEITVKVERRNGFAGRVPVDVRNLPADCDVPALGLNGVLITEDENGQSFLISALPNAKPRDHWLFVAAQVETRSPLENSVAGEPILVKIRPKNTSKPAGSE